MAPPRKTIDELPEQGAYEDTNYLIVQDSGVTKKMAASLIVNQVGTPLQAHIDDATDAHDASAISATASGVGVDGPNVQAQLGQIVGLLAPFNEVQVGTDEPTDAAIELWYDSDEPGGPDVASYTFASDAETIAGVEAAKAVTPANLDKAVYDVEPINAARYGFTRAAVIAALDAAEARGIGTVVYFPAGIYELETGISFNNRSVQLRGDGAAGSPASPTGTVLRAATQTGPVLDFTGYVAPVGAHGKVTHGGFRVVGSGVADATRNNAGIRLGAMGAAAFYDIAIEKTGGPCLEAVPPTPGYAAYFNDFDRIILNTPVSAKANDVAYMRLVGSNGNRLRGCGLRSVLADSDVGVSGAVILVDDGTYPPHDNLFDGWWIESLHVPSGGAIFTIKGNTNVLANFQFFDCGKEAGATGTAHIRLAPPSVTNFGGNLVTGHIPGCDPAGATQIDTGVDLLQSRNSVRGVKGYRGANVTIAAGVTNSDIELGGANSTADNPAVIDNSGSATQRFIDNHLRTETTGPYRRSDASAGGGGPRFEEATTPANGSVYLGTSGTQLRAVANTLYEISDVIVFRNIANTAGARLTVGIAGGPTIQSGAAAPDGAISAPVGSLYMRTGGGAATTLYVKETGTGVTGWVAK